MKKLLFIVFVLVSFCVKAQTPPAGFTFLKQNTAYLNFSAYGTFGLPQDTFAISAPLKTLRWMANKGDSTYLWSVIQQKWILVVGSGGGGGGSTLTISSPLTGGTYNGSSPVTIGINNAAADGSTKGAASFTASDFDASSGNISIDYTNGQAASTSLKGFLTNTDWNTFNGKQSALTFSTGLTNTAGTITDNFATGVSGGQTLIGGTAASNSLTLSSTSNGTKGKFLFGSSTGFVYDENLNAVGIGASPVSVSTGRFFIGGHTGIDAQLAGIQNGDFCLGNVASSLRQPAIVSRTTSDLPALTVITGSTDATTAGDIQWIIKRQDDADFATLTNPAFVIKRASTELFRINRNLTVGIGSGSSTHSTLTVSGSFAPAYIAKGVDYTATVSDCVIELTVTAKTITLPTAVGIAGRMYTVKLTASGTGTVNTTSSQTIDASTTYSLSAQYKYVTVQSNGANWIIIANN